MNKQEILEAINSTIATNGVKGITAESLANVLTEMVNATPEGGSGGGSSAGITFYFGIDEETDIEGGESPRYLTLTQEEKDHNAAMFIQVGELLKNKQTPQVMVDNSRIAQEFMREMYESSGVTGIDYSGLYAISPIGEYSYISEDFAAQLDAPSGLSFEMRHPVNLYPISITIESNGAVMLTLSAE